MSDRYYLERDRERNDGCHYDFCIDHDPSWGIKPHSILMEPMRFIDEVTANEVAKRLNAYQDLYEACQKLFACASLIVEAIAKIDGRDTK
jgi:hypothetical protein